MKISPITILRFNKTNTKIQPINIPKLQPLKKDIVSFGHFTPTEVPDDIQLYRCIGKEEYQKLINGEAVFSSGYATSDPKGWEARGWNDGFVPEDSNSEQYFITFKTDRSFNVIDKRHSENETRYRIMDEYSLDDISNIRKGINTHGELVWAENFEEAKKQDIENKKSEISRLIKILKNRNIKCNKEDVIDELISYRKEFPQISSMFEELADFSNSDDVNNFARIICKLGNDNDLPKFRRCMESYLLGVPAKEDVFTFLTCHGEESDLNMYTQIAEKNNFQPNNLYIDILANLSEEKDYKNIVNRLDTDKPEDLVLLTHFYKRIDKTGKYLKEVEKTLLKCDKLRRTLKFSDETNDADNLWNAIDICMHYLIKFGNKNSLSVIDLYCEDNPKLIYRYYGAEYAKEKIQKRLNI